jgi:predicted patatin/cPLA2 family phospholipase
MRKRRPWGVLGASAGLANESASYLKRETRNARRFCRFLTLPAKMVDVPDFLRGNAASQDQYLTILPASPSGVF